MKFLDPDLKKILLLFLIWRCLVFLIAYISPLIIRNFGATFPYFEEVLISSKLPHFLWSLGNFDGVHYIRIAQDAYAYEFTQAFFPFYPVLIKIFSYLTFGNFLLSAILISNAAFLFGLGIFYKFLKKIYDEKIATWSCIFLLSFPTSYYFGAVYTEGLFFFMVISAFYLANEGKLLKASIIGVFASSTRLFGILLAPALASGLPLKKMLPILIIPLGLIAYMVFLKIEFNNPIYFLTSQAAFSQERSTTHIVLLPQVFWRYIKILATTQGQLFANAAYELAATIFAFVILIIGRNKVKKDWLVFSFLTILLPTLTGTFNSMPRYIIIAFPIYIILAKIRSSKVKFFLVFIFLILLSISVTFFSQGYWIA